jgi:hypothetical protein
MPRITPTQAVATIRRLFPGASRHNNPQPTYSTGNANALRGIINLVKEVPPEMIVLPEDVYADLILAISAIESQLDTWISRGAGGVLQPVNGVDPVLLIFEALDQCPDEYPPPPAISELTFITDVPLRDSIRSDMAAADRAFVNFEWKAATVLAGAAIEALLHWRLSQPPTTTSDIDHSVTRLVAKKVFVSKPPPDRDNWSLHLFIEVSGDLTIIQASTVTAANLAKDFRNLIHPGKTARTGQSCDRGTARSALAALDHVVRDLTPRMS